MYTTEVRVKSMPVQEWLDHYCFPDLFRDACLHCPDHNMNWSCPPEVPAAAELLGEYRTVHLIGVKVLSASYGVVKKALLEVLLNLEQMVPGSYTVAAGRCEQCEKCSRVMGRVCRRPERLRYSFSAFGFDLTGLARDQLGLELLWAKDGLPEYNVALAAFLTR